MGKWLAAVALVALATGCNYGSGAFTCTGNEQCPGGTCELDHGSMCSHPDPSCASGRRFGDVAGAQSNDCVVDGIQPPVDAAIPVDVAPDATACFGTRLVKLCLDAAPSAPLTTPETINTDTSPLCQHLQSGGNFCVVAGTSITVGQVLRATGTRPLVLLATDTITANARIDVGSHRVNNAGTGAGGDASVCLPGTLPGNNGGGAGGSFVGVGGSGGTPNSGAPAPNVDPVLALRGGCAGQDGAGGAGQKGVKGHGGGAIYLIAGAKIDVRAGIDAAGSGGGGGVSNQSGGGGGGSGGMIGFDAPVVTLAGLVLANGGGGGEGSSNGSQGDAGDDSTSIDPAAGGTGGTTNGGNGGPGSSGRAGGPGFSGSGGTPGQGGGGGGGGAAGLILVPPGSTTGGAQLSPAATNG